MILIIIKALALIFVYIIAWQEKGLTGVVFVLSVQTLIAHEIDTGFAYAQQKFLRGNEEALEKFREERDN